MQGANSGLSEDIVILSGSIQVGSGGVIDAKGKTLGQIADEITAQGQVSASIQDGKFTIKSESGEVSIDAAGDFSRVTGIGSYTVQAGSTSNTSAQNVYISQGAAAGLNGSETVVSGTIKVGSGAEINTAGKTLNQIISEINSQGVVTASIQDGKFTIESEASGISIQATGDMARVSGLASYQVQAGTTTNVSSGSGADEVGFVRQVDRLTEEEAIAQGYTVIKTAAQLSNIKFNLDGKYILMGDIDMSFFTGWTPIGSDYGSFTGTLDGNGYVLKNFSMDFSDENLINGLFGKTDGATIKNLGMENISITTSDPNSTFVANCTGGLIGEAINMTEISNCYVTGEIRGSSVTIGGLIGSTDYSTTITDCSTDIEIFTSAYTSDCYAGGLVGKNANTAITNCSASGVIDVNDNNASGVVTAGGLIGYNLEGRISKSLASVEIDSEDSDYCGGLVGEDRNGTISNCGATGNVQTAAGVDFSGGLVGNATGTNISKSYATGEVNSPNDAAGGLVGYAKFADISDSFATGAVDGYFAGGLIGFTAGNTTILRCYASGYINGGTFSYGLVGSPDSSLTIEYSFWDKQKTGKSEATHNGAGATLSHVSGLKTADFANAANFTNFGWDESIWDFSGSTPTLKNMFSKDDASSSSTLTGSVNTTGMTDSAFYGQSSGLLSFSNGVNVSIDANDTRSEVIQKINDAGLTAEIGSDGKIKITAQGVSDLKVTSDSSGFADFYGLSSSGKTYSGSVSSGSSVSQPATSTITGSVNTNNFADNYFYGQTDGQISFSNGVNVSVSATDTRSDVLDKINDAGLTSTIGSDGKIQITAEGVSDLKVNSDSSGFSNFYGLDDSQDTHTGSISTSTETVPDPDGGDGGDGGDGSGTGGDGSGTGGDGSGTGGDGSGTGGDGSGTGGDGSGTGGGTGGTDPDGGNTGGNDDDEPQKPPFDVAGLKTEGVSNIRLQVGTDSSESSALYCDTTFLFDEFSLDMSSAEDCEDSIDAIDALIDAVKSKQTDVGVYMTRLEVIYDTNVMKQEHKYAAYSSIMDADIAAETQKYVEYQIRQQTAMSLLAQTQAARTQMIMTLLSSVMG